MRLGYDPLKFLSLEGIELTVAKLVLEEANHLHALSEEARDRRMAEAVQIGVAKAFGAK